MREKKERWTEGRRTVWKKSKRDSKGEKRGPRRKKKVRGRESRGAGGVG